MTAQPAPFPADDEPSLPRPRPASVGRNLPVAIVVGVSLSAGFLAALFWNPYAFLTFIFAMAVIGLLELDSALRAQGIRPATPVAIGVAAVMCYGAYAAGPSAQTLGIVLLSTGTITWTLFDRHGVRAADQGIGTIGASIGATFFIALWVPLGASFIGLLLAQPDGIWLVMAVVALTVTNDIGAYAWGSRLGRHKLAPTVSPAKTWEGFVGGVLTVVLLAVAITSRLPGFDLRRAAVLGVGVAIAATIGDLAESMVKRDLGVKDLGRILPGHGGVMDRVDAILFTLPVGYLLLRAFPA